jgi:hypothetical protein
MISPLARIHHYFVIKQSGTPSSTLSLDYAASCSRVAHEPPAWLVRHCEVGDAIAALPSRQEEAVTRRWEFSIRIEECDRAMCMVAHRINEGVRANESVTDWMALSRKAEAEAGVCRMAVRKIDRSRAYRAGMVLVIERLSDQVEEST